MRNTTSSRNQQKVRKYMWGTECWKNIAKKGRSLSAQRANKLLYSTTMWNSTHSHPLLAIFVFSLPLSLSPCLDSTLEDLLWKRTSPGLPCLMLLTFKRFDRQATISRPLVTQVCAWVKKRQKEKERFNSSWDIVAKNIKTTSSAL